MRRTGFGVPYVVAASVLMGQLASAAASHPQVYSFNLPAQELGSALRALGETCKQDIIFPEALVRGKRSAPLVGSFTAEQGLQRLLAGSGIAISRAPSGILSLIPDRNHRRGRYAKIISGT